MGRVLIILSLIAAGGCASAVGWGKSFEIVHANSRSVTVKYDALLADFKHFGPGVDAHCAKFGREAVPEGRKDSFGGVHTITFRCE